MKSKLAILGILFGLVLTAMAWDATNISFGGGPTNYLPPVYCEPHLWYRPVTNIVIQESYEGTIQVGTNIYTMKQLQDLKWIPKSNFVIFEKADRLTVTMENVTNWTGTIVQGQELGYVTSEHVAHIEHLGESYTYTLKSLRSNTAVWRSMPSIYVATNGWRSQLNWTNIHGL